MKTKINTAVWSISKLKVTPKSSCDKKKKKFFFFFCGVSIGYDEC